jgi:hypothetical protein
MEDENKIKADFEKLLASEKTHSEPFVTLAEYYEMLERHDWFHMMSDDGSVDRKGEENYRKLAKIAERDPMKLQLLKDYGEYMFSGDPWSDVKKPKPVRPL